MQIPRQQDEINGQFHRDPSCVRPQIYTFEILLFKKYKIINTRPLRYFPVPWKGFMRGRDPDA